MYLLIYLKAQDDFVNDYNKNDVNSNLKETPQCGSVCYLKHKHNNSNNQPNTLSKKSSATTAAAATKSGRMVSNNTNPEFNFDLNDTSIDEILLIADDSGTFNNGKLVNKHQQQQLSSSMSSPLHSTNNNLNTNRLSKLPTPFPAQPPHSPSILVNARLVYLNNNTNTENEKSKESFSIDSLQQPQPQQTEQMQTSSVQQNIDRIRERINLITNSRNAVNSTSTPTTTTAKIRHNPNQLMMENVMGTTTSFELMHTPQPDFIDDDGDDDDARDQKSSRGIHLIMSNSNIALFLQIILP